MAVLYNAQTTTTWDGVSSVTFSHTTTGTNRGLIVSLAWYDGSTSLTTGITYAGVALTKITSRISEYNLGIEMWKLANPTTGANNVIISFDDAAGSGAAGAASFTGANQTTATMTGTADSTVANAATINLRLASNANEMVVDAFGSNATATVGAGQVQIFNRSDPYSNICASSYETGTSSVVMSWTLAAADAYAGIAVAIKAALGEAHNATAIAGLINVTTYTPSTTRQIAAHPPAGLINIITKMVTVDPLYVYPSNGLLKLATLQQGTDVAAAGYTPASGLLKISGYVPSKISLAKAVTPIHGDLAITSTDIIVIGGTDIIPITGSIALNGCDEQWADSAPWKRDRQRATDGWTPQVEAPATWAAQADSTGFWTEVKSLKDV